MATVEGITDQNDQLVTTKFNSAFDYAATAWANATTALNELSTVMDLWTRRTIDANVNEPNKPNIPVDLPIAPVGPTIELNLSDIPSPDAVDWEIPDPGDYGITTLPVLNIPDTPNVTVPSDLGAPPDMGVIPTVARPDVVLPSKPTIDDIEFPSLDEGWQVPVLPLVAFPDDIIPTDIPGFNYSEPEYYSELLLNIQAKCSEIFSVGGTGLDPTFEDEMYERAILRQTVIDEEEFAKVAGMFGAAGFALPSGPHASALYRVVNSQADADRILSLEISIDQGKRAFDATQFFARIGVDTENLTIGHFNNVWDRTLRAAEAALQAGLTQANIAIAVTNAKLARYNAAYQSYLLQVQALQAWTERNRLQLEIVRTKVGINQQKIALYQSELDAAQKVIEIYIAELEGVKHTAEIERLKMQGYTAEVEGFVARVRAAIAQYEVFQAQINGEASKVSLHNAKVEGYKSIVEAYSTKAGVEIAEYNAQIAAWEKDTNSKLAGLDAQLKEFQIDSTNYAELIRRSTAIMNADVSRYAAESAHSVAQANNFINQTQVNNAFEERGLALAIQVAQGAATVSAQLASAALNSVSASASTGSRASVSKNENTEL